MIRLCRIFAPKPGPIGPLHLLTLLMTPLIFSQRYRLRWEIGLALCFKLIFLVWLWFACFRADPSRPRANMDDLFSKSFTAFHSEENQP